MLKQLRSKRLTRNVMRGALILVIPSFLAFYGWSEVERNRQISVATVAKVKEPSWLPWPFNRWSSIGLDEMRSAGESLLRTRRLEFQIAGLPPYFPQKSPAELFDRSEILREAVNQRIIRRYAKEHGIVVSEADLKAEIVQRFPQPIDQTFRYYLANRRITEERFMEELRAELLHQRVLDQFLSRSRVSDFELWQEYTLHNEQIQMDYVKIDASRFESSVAIDEAGLEAFFKSNQETYRVPDQRKWQYLSVTLKGVESEMVITDEAARQYYEDKKDSQDADLALRTSPKTLIRQILLKYPDPAKPVADAALLARAKKIRGEADLAGANFGALANIHSEDPTNTETLNGRATLKGGLVGWIGIDERAEWGDAFVNAALALTEQKRLSDVVETPKGVHILYAQEFKKSEPRPFDEVADIARAHAKETLAKDRFEARVEEFREAAKTTSSLQGMGDNLKIKPMESDFIDVDSYVIDKDPGVGSLVKDREYIVTLKQGERSDLLTTDQGAICLLPMESRDSRLPELKEVRARVEGDYRKKQALAMAEDAATEAVKSGATLDSLQRWAEGKGLRVQTSEYFARVNQPAEISERIDDLQKETYKTPIGAVRQSTLSLAGEPAGWIVWRIKGLKPPSRESFEKDRVAFQREQIFLKQWALYEEWLAESAKSWRIDILESKAA